MNLLLATCAVLALGCQSEGDILKRLERYAFGQTGATQAAKTAAADTKTKAAKASRTLILPPLDVMQTTKNEKALLDRLGQVVGRNKRLASQEHIAFVDYAKSITETRFYIYSPKQKRILFSTHIGHSPYSGYDVPTDFSNVPNTRKTSLGLYRVGREYRGQFGRSKRLHGLSPSNSNAYKRAIVVHAMPNGDPTNLYSWGCLTFFEHDLSEAFDWLKRGTYIMVVS